MRSGRLVAAITTTRFNGWIPSNSDKHNPGRNRSAVGPLSHNHRVVLLHALIQLLDETPL